MSGETEMMGIEVDAVNMVVRSRPQSGFANDMVPITTWGKAEKGWKAKYCSEGIQEIVAALSKIQHRIAARNW